MPNPLFQSGAEFGITSRQFGNEDRRWIGQNGPILYRQDIVVDRSTFDFVTNFPNNFLPSGVTLAKITASGLYGPYTPAGTGSLTDATTEVYAFNLADATSIVAAIGGEDITINAADTIAQVAAKLAGVAELDALHATFTVVKSGTTVFTATCNQPGVNLPDPLFVSKSGGSGSPAVSSSTEGAPAQADATGLSTLAGFLHSTLTITPGATGDLIGTLVIPAVVITSHLPTHSGLDAAGQAQLPQTIFRTDAVG